MAEPLRVVGLREFTRELRALDRNLPRELGRIGKKAAEVVVDEAQGNARNLGGVHRKSAPSIKASGSQRKVVIRGGGARFPFFWGAEFGAKQFAQFPSWRGNAWQPDRAGIGYMIHPAIRSTRGKFMDAYGDGIERLSRRAFPHGSGRFLR